MITIQDETDLLPAIHDGPFEEPMWSTFLGRLRQRTRADRAAISFRPPDRPLDAAIQLYAGNPLPEPLLRGYFGPGPIQQPIPSFSLRPNRVYALAELIEPDEPKHQKFVRDVLVPGEVADLRVMRVAEPGGLSAWLTLTRAQGVFGPAEGATLAKTAPHFRQALRTYAEIERHKAGTRIADAVMERLNFGWLRLDAKGVVLEESPGAIRLLRHGAGLRRTANGQLSALDPLVDRRLSEALRSVTQGTQAKPRALNVGQDPWIDLLLVPAASDPASSASGAAIVAYVQGDNRSLADRHEQLAELFGLLPSEARFAMALSRGLSIVEAAEKLGITVETARHYSKKIYAKMGARGQPDLIRFVLTSVLALA